MLRFRMLGTLDLRDPAGRELRSILRRPKLLALLAYLTIARPRGFYRRDSLVALLWPELDHAHARNALRQAVHSLREALGQDAMQGRGEEELGIDEERLWCDVRDLETALDAGAAERALELYRGELLSGLHVSGVPEFERWLDEEREHLRRGMCVALERLATEAAAAGEHRSAAERWRRLSVLDPLNSRIILRLMDALATSGDRAAALQVARVHEGLLREELDAGPEAAVADLAERLRVESNGRAAAPRAAPVPAIPERVTVPDESARAPVARRASAAKQLAAMLALAVGSLVAGRWLVFGGEFGAPSAQDIRTAKRLVVLPFTNLGSADDAYFTDGITEELTARLAVVDRLRVIGSTSANTYRNTNKALPEIGKELGVQYVLEGSVRWQRSAQGPPRVRVTPQLVSTADGTHLWAEVYDEPLDEIFRVQSDIAQKVVHALNVTLLEQQRRTVAAAPTTNLEAYDYYLRGNAYVRQGTEERPMRAAVQMYEKAVEVDPTFAVGYARLSRAHSRMYWMYYDHSEERLAKAKMAADKAFKLGPGLSEAHQSLGAYYLLGHLDYDRALREFAAADVSRNDLGLPTPMALLLQRQGKFREALAEYEKAFQLDPASSQRANLYAQNYDLLRDFPRAEVLYNRAIALAPDRTWPYFWKVGLHLRWDGSTLRAREVLDKARSAGVADDPILLFARVLVEIFDHRYEDALGLLSSRAPEVIEDQFRFIPRAQLYAQIYGLMLRRDLEQVYYDSARTFVSRKVQEWPEDPRLRSALGIAYAGLGRKQEAIREGQKAVELLPISKEAWRGYYRALDLARIHTMVGDHGAAIDQLEYLLSIPGHVTVAWLRIDPTWDPLRGHPRFRRLVDGRK